jgi:ribosomal protein L7/L12
MVAALNPYKDKVRSERAADLERRCAELMKRHKKVEAVKLYRTETGCGLRQALEAVERLV